MERSELVKGYNGEVTGEVKLEDWGTKSRVKPKLPDLQKAMKESRLLADKTSVKPCKPKEKKSFTRKNKSIVSVNHRSKVSEPVKKKLVKKTPVRKKEQKQVTKNFAFKEPVKKKPVKKQEVKKKLVTKQESMEDIFQDFSFIPDIEDESSKDKLRPEIWTSIGGFRNEVNPEPPLDKIVQEVKPELLRATSFPYKEIILIQSISNAEDLDEVCELGSRVLVIERKHPIFIKTMRSLENSLRFQYIRRDSQHSRIFDGVIHKVVSYLRGKEFKFPFYGYNKTGKNHIFLLLDFMYTRINTAYYILADEQEGSNIPQRLILVNADIIFTK